MALPPIAPGQWLVLGGSYIDLSPGGTIWRGRADGTTDPAGQTFQELGNSVGGTTAPPNSGSTVSINNGNYNEAAALWTGAAYDTKRGEFVFIAPGGHGPLGDNSIWAHKTISTQTWERRRNPGPIPEMLALAAEWHGGNLSAVPPIPQGPVITYWLPTDPVKRAPQTAHSYGSDVYMPSVDRFLRAKLPQWPGDARADSHLAEWDPITTRWSAPTVDSLQTPVDLGIIVYAAWDPFWNKALIMGSNAQFVSYDPTKPDGARLSYLSGSGAGIGNSPNDWATCAFVDDWHLYAMFGVVGSNNEPGLTILDLELPLPLVKQNVALVDTNGSPVGIPAGNFGDGPMNLYRSPAFWYDKVRKELCVYYVNTQLDGTSTGTTLYAITLRHRSDGTWQGIVRTETPSNLPPPMPQQGMYNKVQYVTSDDVVVMLPRSYDGLYGYRRISQARVHAFTNKVFQKWYGESGIQKVDHGNGAPGGAAGGPAYTTDDKFCRGAYDTTRNVVVQAGGNIGWLGHGNIRGQSTVLAIDPSTATPANGNVAAPWSTYTQVCEGPSRTCAEGENQTFCYDGPQLGQAGAVAPKDLFYIRPGNQDPGMLNNVSYAASAGVAPSGSLSRHAILNPVLRQQFDGLAPPYSWNIPTNWETVPNFAGDQLCTTPGDCFHQATRSVYRLWSAGAVSGRAIERHHVDGDSGRGLYTLYSIGAFNTGNGETDLQFGGQASLHHENLCLDPVGWKLYVVNPRFSKLAQFDIRKMLTKYNAGTAAGTQIAPANAAEDWTREFSFPSPCQGLSVGDGTMVHAVTTFDQQNRRVIVGLTGGTCGEWYAAYAFNPAAVTSPTGVEAFETLSLTNGDFPGGFHQGEFVHVDWGVYDPYHNEHVYMGGKNSGNAAAYSPTWVPTNGPYVLTGTSTTDQSLPGAFDSRAIDDPLGPGQTVWHPASGTIYTRGTHYNQTDSGGTTTWTNIGGMAASVVILLRVPHASEFARFRYNGVGTAPISTQPSINTLSPSSAVVGGPAFTLTVTGDNFLADAVVLWNGSPRNTTFVSTTQVQATILPPDIAVLQVAVPVTVTTSLGGVSPPRNFAVTYGPTTLTLTWQGMTRDCVRPGPTGGLAADGQLDAVMALTVHGTGGRTIIALRLQPNPADEWNTLNNGKWVLGVATSANGALVNNPTTLAVNQNVADGDTLWLFASDAATPTYFPNGATLTVLGTFEDGTTSTATTVVSPVGVVATAAVFLIYRRK